MWWCCRRISTIVTNQFVGIEGVELGSADKVSASIWFWSAIIVVGNLYLDQLFVCGLYKSLHRNYVIAGHVLAWEQ